MPTPIDKLFLHLDKFMQHSPVRVRSKTVGAWAFPVVVPDYTASFHFSLTRRKGYVYLSDVWVPANRRQNGVGRTGMESLGILFNAFGVPCVLDARGYDGGMGTRRLRKWYEQFGFRETVHGRMRREPK